MSKQFQSGLINTMIEINNGAWGPGIRDMSWEMDILH